MKIELLPHAERQLLERNINFGEVKKILKNPDQIIETSIKDRKIAQKIITKRGKKFLYRVVFGMGDTKHLVVTAYRTTKIGKYLKGEHK